MKWGKKWHNHTKSTTWGKSKKDEEKLQDLKQKHLRPKNAPNLQAPKIEAFLWRQLKWDVKKVDYVQQKAVLTYGQAITPLIKELKHIQLYNQTRILKLAKVMSWTPSKTYPSTPRPQTHTDWSKSRKSYIRSTGPLYRKIHKKPKLLETPFPFNKQSRN